MTSDGSTILIYNLRAFFTRITFVSLGAISTHFNCCSLFIYWISGIFRNGYVDLSLPRIIQGLLQNQFRVKFKMKIR